MYRYLLIVICIIGLYSFAVSESSEKTAINGTDLLPDVVITASRYQYEDDAWSGLMPEVTVTAPRFEYEDDAWGGLMPEVVVTAYRFEYEDDAWSGLMPGMTVMASRYGAEDKDSFLTLSESRPQNDGGHLQQFNIDGNLIIILSILGSAFLFIGLSMLPRYLRKARTPANCVCCSK